MASSTTSLSLLSALLVAFGITLSGCDAEPSEPDEASFELSDEEIVELETSISAQGHELYPELPESAEELAAPEDEQQVSAPSLSDCFMAFCWQDRPWLAHDGQCSAASHPLDMPGVCILTPEVENALQGCGVYEWYGEYCSTL